MTYAIMLCGSEWKVVGPRGRIGYFGSIEDAISTGRRLSSQAMEAGLAVELLIQNNVGQLVPLTEALASPGQADAPAASGTLTAANAPLTWERSEQLGPEGAPPGEPAQGLSL